MNDLQLQAFFLMKKYLHKLRPGSMHYNFIDKLPKTGPRNEQEVRKLETAFSLNYDDIPGGPALMLELKAEKKKQLLQFSRN